MRDLLTFSDFTNFIMAIFKNTTNQIVLLLGGAYLHPFSAAITEYQKLGHLSRKCFTFYRSGG